VKEQEVDLPCPAYELCHAGLAGNRACDECRGLKTRYCDDTDSSTPPDFRCCQTCPEGYRNTDVPCMGDGSDLGTCGAKPPECP
jgi:hypothetical protein